MPLILRVLFLALAVLCFVLAALQPVRGGRWNARWLPIGLALFVSTFLWDAVVQLD